MINVASRVGAFTYFPRTLDRWNNRRGGVILVFHEISRAELFSHLDLVSQMYSFVSLSELVNRIVSSKSTSGLAVITFDDGYGPVVESAAEYAALNGCPMTFYLPTRYLDSGEPYWFQELRPMVQGSNVSELKVAGLALSLNGRNKVSDAIKRLDTKFRSLASAEEVEALLRETRHALNRSEERQAGLRTTEPVSWDRVRELARREELSFQAHSVHHLALSRLSEDAVRNEMEQSRKRISEMTGREVNHFCYPYGGQREIGPLARRLALQHFQSATTMIRGRCGRDADPAMLPRIPLYAGDSLQTVALKVGLAR
jgi:peptidoglycan/xylan/chitin deacetylase (PgdA/CDA1 family)